MNGSLLRTEGKPAPGDLVLVHGFLNTWSKELGIEDFETAHSTAQWLHSAGLWMAAEKLDSRDHQRIVQFRDSLRAWMMDEQGPQQQWLDIAAEISFRAAPAPSGELRFDALGSACDRALGALVNLISESMRSGSWDRLKCCDLPTCGWAFYDATRSRTKRWCSMKTCGSRHKSREYYKRNQNRV